MKQEHYTQNFSACQSNKSHTRKNTELKTISTSLLNKMFVSAQIRDWGRRWSGHKIQFLLAWRSAHTLAGRGAPASFCSDSWTWSGKWMCVPVVRCWRARMCRPCPAVWSGGSPRPPCAPGRSRCPCSRGRWNGSTGGWMRPRRTRSSNGWSGLGRREDALKPASIYYTTNTYTFLRQECLNGKCN